MRPFLLLATRAEDEAADEEYAAFLRFSGLPASHLVRHRLERDPLGEVDLDAWSGIVLGGGPFTVSDPEATKSEAQVRAEADLDRLLTEVVARDFPFLGACYGIGTLGRLLGGAVDREYGEPIGEVVVTVSDAGRSDPLLAVLPAEFHAFVGHKEALRAAPPGAVLLASSPHCPVQAFRVGRHGYATQFHPELDVAGLCTRIEVYKHHGYFEPHEAESLKAMARAADVTAPPLLVRRFVELFARD